MLLNCGVGEDSWESLGLQGDPTSPSWRKSTLNIHWKYWCWSWNSNTLATWCEKLIHWKSPWCWERLRAGGEGDDRGWHGWVTSTTRWTWVWVDSGSWWWRPGMLWFMGSQSQTWLSDWTELNTTLNIYTVLFIHTPNDGLGVLSTFWLQWVVLLWIFYGYLFGYLFSGLLVMYLE